MTTTQAGETLAKRFPAFRSRNFRLFIWSQIPSFIGTWFQATGAAILIYQLTGSATWTAAAASMVTLPGLCAPIGGTFVDRYGSRRVMYWTNGVAMIPAFALGIATLAGIVNKWEILAAALVGGMVNAFDSPARQANIVDGIPEDQIQSGTSINSALVHTTQFIGPSLAAIAIPIVGIGWTFIINGVSFIAVIVALRKMELHPHPHHNGVPVADMVKVGLRYATGHQGILFLMVLYALAGMWGYAFRGIIPAIAHVFWNASGNRLAEITGNLMAATGIGSGIGAIIASASHDAPPRKFLFGGTLLMGVSLALFSVNRNLFLAIVLFWLAGFGFTACTTMIRSTLWRLIDRTMQGRVMGIIIASFFIGMGIGTYSIGILADRFGIPATLAVNGLALIALTGVLVIFRNKIPGTHAMPTR